MDYLYNITNFYFLMITYPNELWKRRILENTQEKSGMR